MIQIKKVRKYSKFKKNNNKVNKRKNIKEIKRLFNFKNNITIICAILIIICLCSIIKTMINNNKAKKVIENMDKNVIVYKENSNVENKIEIDFEKLNAINHDVAGWIYNKDLQINYPIVQGNDNFYYLSHLLNKEENSSGSLFLDASNNKKFNDFNSIIYGHNMKNGTMFSQIVKYNNQEYYDNNKEIYLLLPNEKYKIQIVSAFEISVLEKNIYKTFFNSEEEKNEYLEQIKRRSLIKTNIDVNSNDKILMLSTCINYKNNYRFIVYGKMVKI